MINIHEQIFLTTFSSGTFNSALYLMLLLTVLPTCLLCNWLPSIILHACSHLCFFYQLHFEEVNLKHTLKSHK